MRIDATLMGGLAEAAASAKDLEAAGYDGAWTAETAHDPFLPLVQAAADTSSIELGTSIAVAFARNPMLLANLGWDLQAFSKGRFADQTAYHEAILNGVELACGSHARDDQRRPCNLGHLGERNETRLPWRFLSAHVDDPVLHT